jgi:MFS family permease
VPLRSYRGERLVVMLIALAALAVVNPPAAAVSRVALADALLEGRVTIDEYAGQTIDRARYEGHYYSDKAPGLSAVAAIPVAVLDVADPGLVEPRNERLWNPEGSFSLWAICALVGGCFFVLGVVLVGRVAEAVAPRTGAAAAVAYGLGTLAHPLAPALFGHIPAGTLGLAALLLAGRSTRLRLLAAGGCAGAAVLIEYQAALIAVALLIYALWRHGARAAAVVAAGGLPAIVLLGLYDVAAFGSPFRLSYQYVDNVYAERQSQGLFGIGLPDPDALWMVLVGERGLLLLSPVLVLAAGGLWLLVRQGFRREAAVAAGVTVAFLVVNSGYFLPYGGVSPGPRIFATCIPLLALGFGPAFARWPRTTYAATAFSVLAMTSASLSWAFSPEDGLLIPSQETLTKTIWMALAGDRIDGALLTGALAVAALCVAAYSQLSSRASGTQRTPAS